MDSLRRSVGRLVSGAFVGGGVEGEGEGVCACVLIENNSIKRAKLIASGKRSCIPDIVLSKKFSVEMFAQKVAA